MSAVLYWLFVLFVVLAPLPLGANRPGVWAGFALVLGILLLGWSVAGRLSPHEPLSLHRLKLPLILFTGLTAWFFLQAAPWLPGAWHHPDWAAAAVALDRPLAGAISLSPEATVDAAMRFLTYGGVFLLACQLGRDRLRAKRFLWCLVLAGMLYAVYGLWSHLSGANLVLWYDRWAYQDSVTSTFINRNTFATYAGLTLLVGIALLMQALIEAEYEANVRRDHGVAFLEQFAARGWLLMAAVMLIAGAILLSQSRAGFAAMAVGAMVLVALRYLAGNASRGIALLVFGAVAVLLALAGQATIARISDDAGNDLGWRLKLYGDVLEAIAAFPIFGTGLGTFENAFRPFRSEALISLSGIDKAHNTYLEFALEAGLPALLVVLVLFASLLWICIRGLRRRQRDTVYPALAISASALVATHALVDFSVQIPAVAITYMAILGIGVAQSWSTRNGDETAPRARRLARAGRHPRYQH